MRLSNGTTVTSTLSINKTNHMVQSKVQGQGTTLLSSHRETSESHGNLHVYNTVKAERLRLKMHLPTALTDGSEHCTGFSVQFSIFPFCI